MTPQLPGAIAASIEQFTGRAWVLPPLLKWLEESTDRLFVITGAPGTGKSMLAAWLAGAGPAPTVDDDRARLAAFRARVGGVHFCIAASGTTAPKAFADHMARQLTETVRGFGAALAASLSDRVQISGRAEVTGDVQAGGAATGVTIGTLNLGDLGEELSFNRVLREPLERLYADGFDEPLVLVVDGLDEAATYTGAITIVQLLTKLGDLPEQVRVVATTRPDPRVLYLFPGVEPFDLLDRAPPTDDDVLLYAQAQLADLPDEPARRALAERIADAAEGVFLYARLVLGDLPLRQPVGDDPALAPLPKKLSGLYLDSLNRQLGPDRSRWFGTFKPLLGLVAVAQGDGLTQAQLARIRRADVAEPLEVLKQYLDGPFPDGPFRPFHRSFTEFLEDPSSVAYRIEPGPMHRQVADYYWAQANGAAPWRRWDAYGVRYTPTHLTEAAEASEPAERHDLAGRLVGLMASPDFQGLYHEQVDDLAALQQDLERAVRTAAADSDVSALPLVAESVLALARFRREHLRPEPVLELARRGGVDAAAHRLDLFDVDPEWQQAARLIVAWLGFDRAPELARQLRDRVAATLQPTPPLPLLLERLDARMGGPAARFEPLPPSPPAQLARALVDRMGGAGGDVELLASYGLGGDELVAAGGFLSEQDGPQLVAYAAQPESPGEDGGRFLAEYIAFHATYNYPVYRNNSLRWLLAAVLRHPDEAWVESMLPRLAETALAGSRADFQGALPLAILAWRAQAGTPEALQAIEERRQGSLAAALELTTGRGRRDTWGRHGRRLAALAEPLALLLGRPGDAARLLEIALAVPYGFAGFRSPACLTLAESMHICRQGRAAVEEVLSQARRAAHNIQDPSFCARSTARVNAMVERWWAPVGVDPAAIERLVDDPSEAEFSALHYIGESYPARLGPSAFPFDELLAADTLAGLARVFQRPLGDFQRLNPGRAPEERLAAGTAINVPDPGLPPRLAARFAADLLVDGNRSAEGRVRQLQALVPVAAVDPTAADAVLARLVVAAALARRPDPLLLDELERAAAGAGDDQAEEGPPTVRLPS